MNVIWEKYILGAPVAYNAIKAKIKDKIVLEKIKISNLK